MVTVTTKSEGGDVYSAIVMYAKFVLELLLINLSLVGTLLLRIPSLFISPPLKSLKGEIVLVTGGTKGLGRAILLELARREKDLTLISWGRDTKQNESIVKELKTLGVSRAFAYDVDLSDSQQVAGAAAKVRKEVGEVTMLFNNAGTVGPLGRLWQVDMGDIRRTLEVNATSHIATVQEFVPPMIQSGKGHVIAVASPFSFSRGPTTGAYTISKHAQEAAVESLKEDLRKAGVNEHVKVSMVYPGIVKTKLYEGLRPIHGYPFLAIEADSAEAATKLVDGVCAEKEYVYLAWTVYVLHISLTLLPPPILRQMLDMFGYDPKPVPSPT